mgnify:CR=1 FL=1
MEVVQAQVSRKFKEKCDFEINCMELPDGKHRIGMSLNGMEAEINVILSDDSAKFDSAIALVKEAWRRKYMQ